ncbi:hypothetical protein [Streptomyces sp. I05A-00742]|uniref:hypothetical protein n=1 Tax=Streptomyces sp. I05A-00742 TaxID=2732853 RepID=UPI0014894D33|nr:hypothetical protein [Streptomyces sp. I05A-00742]
MTLRVTMWTMWLRGRLTHALASAASLASLVPAGRVRLTGPVAGTGRRAAAAVPALLHGTPPRCPPDHHR